MSSPTTTAAEPPPDVSVVIGCNDAAESIGPCLDALLAQEGALLEIIVSVGASNGTAEEVRRRLPHLRLLELGRPASLAKLRGRAIRQAKGAVVAVVDAYAIVAPDWLRMTVLAHREHASQVVGGSVDLYGSESANLMAWAKYINEYGLFMPPVRSGPVGILPGCNISYKREALCGPNGSWGVDFWKTFLNESIREAGQELFLDDRMTVSLFKPVSSRNYLATRYLHGRCFAAMRSRPYSRWQRLGRVFIAPIVPFVLYSRLFRACWPRKRNRAQLLLTAPLHLLFYANWMCGEVVGYLFGSGDSCRRLYF